LKSCLSRSNAFSVTNILQRLELEQQEKQSYYNNLNTFGFLGMSKNPVATVLVINARLVLSDGQQSSCNP